MIQITPPLLIAAIYQKVNQNTLYCFLFESSLKAVSTSNYKIQDNHNFRNFHLDFLIQFLYLLWLYIAGRCWDYERNGFRCIQILNLMVSSTTK